MKNQLQKINIVIVMLMSVFWVMPVSAQTSGIFWYIDGIADYWFVQPDVFAFRCINGQAFTGSTDPNVVDSIYHHASRQDQAVEVYFKPSSTPSERLAEVQNIFASGQVEMPYLTITKDTLQPYGDNQRYAPTLRRGGMVRAGQFVTGQFCRALSDESTVVGLYEYLRFGDVQCTVECSAIE